MARRNHRPGLRSATLVQHLATALGRTRTLSGLPPLLARLPGLAERPERNPEQGQVLDEELPRDRREGGEATETWLPDARRRDEEAQGREEHPTARALPRAEARGQNGRAAMSSAMATST